MSESIAPPAPPASVGAPAPTTGSVANRAPLKIGIVSPYGYPHPGGVNEHVRHAYEAMRRLGHDVWIITSKYGKERTTEGRVIPPGHRLRVPGQRQHGPRHARLAVQGAGTRAARRAPVRHPALPRAVRAVPVADRPRPVGHGQHRDLPRLRRLLAVVLGRQELRRPAGRQAARPDRGQRGGPALHQPLLPRATTRSSPTASTWTDSPMPSHSRSCATARSTSCSWVASKSARA